VTISDLDQHKKILFIPIISQYFLSSGSEFVVAVFNNEKYIIGGTVRSLIARVPTPRLSLNSLESKCSVS
jgi:hypothetical protein